MKRALIAIYAAVGIVSFGHCWEKHPGHFMGSYHAPMTANKAFLAGMLWPLYWSVEAWRAAA